MGQYGDMTRMEPAACLRRWWAQKEQRWAFGRGERGDFGLSSTASENDGELKCFVRSGMRKAMKESVAHAPPIDESVIGGTD